MLSCKSALIVVAATLTLWAQPGFAAPLPAPVLPVAFAGWQQKGAPSISADPGFRSKDEAQWLKEDGFASSEVAEYQREGDTLKLTLLRFPDASGAYSAYTLLRQPHWPKEEIGAGAVSDNNRVLFWLSNLVVDAGFSHITAMSAGELRVLAGQLPTVKGNASLEPPITHYLPTGGLEPQTTRYALGPAAYTQCGGALPPALLGFDRGAEALGASYLVQGNEGVLTLIEYPTPQMAEEREKAIADFFKAGNQKQNPWPQALAESNPLALIVRRTGPLVVITTGGLFDRQAKELAGRVYYQADISTLPGSTQPSEVSKTAKLIIGIVLLVSVLGGAALVLGIFFGGGRILLYRLRGKDINEVDDSDSFLSLNLSESTEAVNRAAPQHKEPPQA